MLWGWSHGEQVLHRSAARAVGKRSRKRWLILSGVVTERGVANFVEVGRTLERGVRQRITRPNAGRTSFAKELAQRPFMISHQVGKAKTGTKVVPAGRSQGARNAGIAGKDPSCRGTGEHHRLLTRNEGLNLVIFFP